MKEFLVGFTRVTLLRAENREEAQTLFYEALKEKHASDELAIEEVNVV
jgi:hypothetical protein